jgi:hypothetical protein
VNATDRLDVLCDGEHCPDLGGRPVGEEVGAGVQGPPVSVERVARTAAAALRILLGPAPTAVERATRQIHDAERVHHRDRGWQRLTGGGLEGSSQPT